MKRSTQHLKPGLLLAAVVALAATPRVPSSASAPPDRPWQGTRRPGDWSVRKGPTAADSTPAGAAEREIGGSRLPLRRIVDLVDDAGRFIDLPEFYQLGIETVRAAAGPGHPLLGCLHVRYAGFLWRHIPARAEGSPYDPRDPRSRRSGSAAAATASQRARALEEAIAGEDILREAVRLDLRQMTDVDARRLAIHRESALDLVLSLAACGATPPQLAAAWATYLRSRAVVLDELAERQRAIAASDDSMLAGLWKSLDAARSRLAELSFAPLRDGDHPAEELARARAEVTRLEGQLAARSARFRAGIHQRSIGLEEVSRHLRPGEALVGYAYYRDLSPLPPPARAEAWRSAPPVRRDSIQVLAFVLPGAGQAVQVVRLGEAATLDALADRWRRSLGEGLRDTASEARDNAAGDSLRRRVWDPIEPLVRGARRVHVVMDGALQLINLSALPEGPSGRSFVIERAPVLSYLCAERDLARQPSSRGTGLLAMGGAEFGGGAPASPERGAEVGCARRGTLRFGALPSSGDEVAAVSECWRLWHATAGGADPVLQLLGLEASERAFRDDSRSREALHVATHGFFIEDSCFGLHRPAGVSARAGQLVAPLQAEDDPLLASGIALAGANDRLRRAAPDDDGILTAAEIASLDLGAVRWVVLSACETGLGAAAEREGVLGLRRAFVAAGAGTVVSSLWRVDDRLTLDFMRHLYDARFRDGESTPEAMRDAALSLLQRRRKAGLPPAPAVWGAFIAVGPPEAPPAPPSE